MNIASLLPIVLLGVVFYFLLIRPQQRAKAASRVMQSSLSPGDEVSTVGGIFGIVRDVDTATVDIEVSEDVIVRFDRRSVNRIVRDVPAEDADRHRIDGDDEDEDDVPAEAMSESPVAADEPATPATATDDGSTSVDAPEPAR